MKKVFLVMLNDAPMAVYADAQAADDSLEKYLSYYTQGAWPISRGIGYASAMGVHARVIPIDFKEGL